MIQMLQLFGETLTRLISSPNPVIGTGRASFFILDSEIVL